MCVFCFFVFIFFFKQKTAYEMRISDWSADVCSSDLTLSVPRPIRRNFLNLPPPDTLGYKLGASLCQIGRGSRDEPGHGLTRRFGIPGAYCFEDTAEESQLDRSLLRRIAK